jgi:hypothetical protein
LASGKGRLAAAGQCGKNVPLGGQRADNQHHHNTQLSAINVRSVGSGVNIQHPEDTLAPRDRAIM